MEDPFGRSEWKILSFRKLEWEILLKDQNVRSFLLEDQEDQRMRDHFLWKIRKTNVGDPFGRLEGEILPFRRLGRPNWEILLEYQSEIFSFGRLPKRSFIWKTTNRRSHFRKTTIGRSLI